MGRRKNKPADVHVDDDPELTDGEPDGLAENDDALGDEDDDGEADPIPADPDHPAPGADPAAAGASSPRAATAPGAGAPTGPGSGDEDDDGVEGTVTEFGGYLHHEAKRPVKAKILSRSSADRNVVTLKLKDGTIHESVPLWNEEGPRPTFPVWVE